MFGKVKEDNTRWGNFFSLFTNKERFFKYLQGIIIGVPLWFVVGILITLSPEFGKVLRVQGDVNAGAAVAWCYGGLVLRDIVSGMLSQYLKSGREATTDPVTRELRPFVFEAQKREVIWDVGHGAASFSFSHAIPASKAGFWPDVISTDHHGGSMNSAMKDVVSSILHLIFK